jgi:hypothetical protein
MDKKILEALEILGNQYFDLVDDAKIAKDNVESKKAEIETFLLNNKIENISVGEYNFAIKSKVKKKFQKASFSKDAGVNKKEVDEKFIAEMVENGKTSSTKIASFFEVSKDSKVKISKNK